MRVRIVFRLKNRGGIVPFHHQHLLAQLIKGVIIKGGNPAFLNYNGYNFSGLKGQTRVSRKGLHFFSSRVTLVFSSSSREFVNYFIEKLFELEEVEIGNLILFPEQVEEEESVNIESPAKFVCISPLVLTKPVFGDKNSKRFIHPDTDPFSDLLFESTMSRMAETGNFTESEMESFYKFQVVPDSNYIQKLDQSQKKYARIYSVYDNDVKYEIRGYTFPFELYAMPQVLDFVFKNGIGYVTHKGFGMLDLANHHPDSKVIYSLAREEVSDSAH